VTQWSLSVPAKPEERIHRLNQYMLDWSGYFRLASAQTHCQAIDLRRLVERVSILLMFSPYRPAASSLQ